MTVVRTHYSVRSKKLSTYKTVLKYAHRGQPIQKKIRNKGFTKIIRALSLVFRIISDLEKIALCEELSVLLDLY